MNKQSACFICVKNRPCMSYTRLLHASPLARICELLSPNNKGSCCKNRARVVSLKGFWNVNKFRRRTVRKKRTALIFEEKQMHHSKSEIKGIPLFSTHWLHIHYCVNGPWIIFVTFVNSLNFILQNLYTFLFLLSKRAKFFCWPFCQTTIFIFPTKPEVDFKNKRWCALRCIKPELLAFKFWKSVHWLPSYVATTLWHTDRQTYIHTDRQTEPNYDIEECLLGISSLY